MSSPSCRAPSTTRPSRSSSRTSCASAEPSPTSTPPPADRRDPARESRARKERRGPKRATAPSGDPRNGCEDAPPPELRKGVEEFNERRFYEQHETLELLWRATDAPIRDLYHGILQVGVGLHHWSRGNFHGASVLLAEGLARLEPFGPACQGVDVAALIEETERLRARLAELGPERMSEVDVAAAAPSIRLGG